MGVGYRLLDGKASATEQYIQHAITDITDLADSMIANQRARSAIVVWHFRQLAAGTLGTRHVRHLALDTGSIWVMFVFESFDTKFAPPTNAECKRPCHRIKDYYSSSILG